MLSAGLSYIIKGYYNCLNFHLIQPNLNKSPANMNQPQLYYFILLGYFHMTDAPNS